MAIYVCPICDHKMKSKHFCTSCRSYIKEPFVREMTYYLNERHPENEINCTYHMSEGEQGHGFLSSSHSTAVPNQPSVASHASLNGAGQTAPVPNRQSLSNRASLNGAGQTASVPNRQSPSNRASLNGAGQTASVPNQQSLSNRTSLNGAGQTASVPNQQSLSNHASLNGAGQTASVPNQPTSYDQSGTSVYRQAATPNQPRKNVIGQPVNIDMENMERYITNMKDMGRNGLKGAAELLKEYNGAARQSRQQYESGQEEKKTDSRRISTISMVIIFIVFVNIFSNVIVPFLRYIMTSIF